jgi:hypothetical protein
MKRYESTFLSIIPEIRQGVSLSQGEEKCAALRAFGGII